MRTIVHWYWERFVIAVLLVLIGTCPDVGARLQSKVVKPPRVGPSPPVRTLVMPQAYAAKAVASGLMHRGLAASKQVAFSSSWTVWRNSTNQTPIFWQFNQPQSAAAKRSTAVEPETDVLQFITENATLFRLRDPASELVHRTTRRDRTGRAHVQLEHRYLGVPIWGSSIVGHWSAEQGLYAINGRYQPSPDYITQINPSIARETAINRALGDLELQRQIKRLSPKMQDLLNYRGPEAKLYLWSARLNEPVRLTWNVEIRPNMRERWYYFVDAHSGQVLDHYLASPSDGPAIGRGVDLHGNVLNLHTYEKDGLFCLIDGSREGFDSDTGNGALMTLNAGYTDLEKAEVIFSFDNTFTDPVAVSAHANMGRIYEYFLQNHGRRGIVGDGTEMISVVHVTEDGKSMENASWNGTFISYGDGGDAFKPFAGALDVAAHEMAHGIIEHTVNLEYRFQSGALNESFADIFGAMVDDEDWLIGEDITNKAYFPSGALRDLRDPHNGAGRGGNGWQPAHMDEYVELDSDVDNGGVHVNSGIPNRAAYLVAEAIGRKKTAQIYYRILEAQYLTSRSQFVDCRLAAERAARDLFGDGSPEEDAVSRAYDAVGIIVEEPSETPSGPLVDPGKHWIATVAAELNGDNSLWMVKPTLDALEGKEGWEYITQLTTTQVFAGTGRAITAPVNGDYLLFIDSDNNLRGINADGSDETVINADGDWSSIALSPNGNRLVATTVYDEPFIYYFDLERENSRRIELYHPTTQDGIRQQIARHADALQWDATGTYVIYDVFNSLPGIGVEAIDFWTVNMLDPTGEAIWSIFPPQPVGVQIGNPSLSSTILSDGTIDDCRLLYERVDGRNARTEIRVKDFCTGEEGVLYTFADPVFTFPGFINGDREIVFEYWLNEDGIDVAHLFRLSLTDNGFSPLGDPLLFVAYSRSPKTIILASTASDAIILPTPPSANPDFDGDGIVGIGDFLLFVDQFGLSQGDAGYNARFDLDGDGIIGIGDFLIFVNAFGKEGS